MDIEITKMTSKGQVVIPQGIREVRNLKDGERFLVYDLDDSIILKRIRNLEKAETQGEFDEIFRSMWKTAKARSVTRGDLAEQIRDYRKEKNA